MCVLQIENETAEPPPKEASIKCPICMNPSVEEMTTRCGHIFCKKCITTALTASRKCPTCGKGATKRGLVRVFLPSTRIIDEECMSICFINCWYIYILFICNLLSHVVSLLLYMKQDHQVMLRKSETTSNASLCFFGDC
jgi:endogenous inhibitor of DNA gyrase (YacG/DUF329 family)